jgi:peptidoglycan/LPS O-acetylase OafA/YrhL
MKASLEARNRNGVIDAYRGIAVIAVMAFHYFCAWAPPYNAQGLNLYRYDVTYAPVFQLGYLGVHLFFVISGLVITMTVLRCRTPFEFAVRRLGRLYPALVISSILTVLIVNSLGPSIFHRTGVDWLASLTFDPERFGHQAVDGAYWSLLVEVKFYFLVALFFHFLGRHFWIGLVTLGLLTLTPLGAISVVQQVLPWYLALFLLGVSGWQLCFERDLKAGIICGLTGILLYAIQLPDYMVHLTYSYLKPVAEIGLTCTIAFMLLTVRLPAPRWLAPLSSVGRWSYAIYLLHQNIGVSVIRLAKRGGAPDLAAVAMAASIVVALAWLVHVWVELPGQAAILRRYRALVRRGSMTAIPDVTSSSAGF